MAGVPLTEALAPDAELTSDQLDALAAQSAGSEQSGPRISFPGNNELTTAQLDAMESAGRINDAASAVAPTPDLSQSYAKALTGVSPSFSPFPSTGAGPIKTELTPQEMDQLTASQLQDPNWTPQNVDEFVEARDAAKRIDPGIVANTANFINGMVQMAAGGIQDMIQADDSQKVSNLLEGGRRALLNTAKGLNNAFGYSGRAETDMSPDEAEYHQFLANQHINRAIADPLYGVNWVPSGINVSNDGSVSVQTVGDLPRPQEDAANLTAMVAAPENVVAGQIAKAVGPSMGIASKAATGRVLQTIGRTGLKVDDTINALGEAAIARFQRALPDLPPAVSEEMARNVGNGIAKAGYGVAAGIGIADAAHGEEGSNPIGAVLTPIAGYFLLRNGATVFRGFSKAANAAGAVFREAADPIGPLRADAVTALASNPEIPSAYRQAMASATAPAIDSTPSRIANNTSLPDWQRGIAKTFDRPGLVNAIRTVGGVVEGATTGALSTVPFVLSADPGQDTGGLMAGAAIFGAGHGLAGKVHGPSVEARTQDIARFLADQKMLGGDPVAASQLARPRLEQLAAAQALAAMKGTDLIALKDGDYRANKALLNAQGTAGLFIDAPAGQRPRIFVNLDAKNPAEIHEWAHAVMGSQIMDGGLRSPLRGFVDAFYKPADLQSRAESYAKNELTAEDAAAKEMAAKNGMPFQSPAGTMEDRIAARIAEKSQNYLADPTKGATDPLDWVRDEVAAEEINHSGADLNKLRQGESPFADPGAIGSALIAAKARVLQALGAPIDAQSGALKQPLSKIFNDAPLLGATNEGRKMLATYLDQYRNWLADTNADAQGNPRGVKLGKTGPVNPYELVRSGNVVLRPTAEPGVTENAFLRNDKGQISYKSQAEIDAAQAAQDAQVKMLVGSSIVPKADPTLGRRSDGKIVGSKLPASFDGLAHFGPWIRSLARTIEQGFGNGNTWEMLYHRIGTGDSGSYKILNMGNTEAIRREMIPFEWEVTKKGKLCLNCIDATGLQKKLLTLLNDGKLESFDDNLGQFHNDLQTYLRNHATGLPGENAIGVNKRNVINAILGPGTKAHSMNNPLAGTMGRPLIRKIRVDRLEDAKMAMGPDGQPKQGFQFDYDKVVGNRMPDPRPYQDPTGGIVPQGMPDVGEENPYKVETTRTGKFFVRTPNGERLSTVYPNIDKAQARATKEWNLSKSINELKRFYGPEDRKALTAAQQRIAQVAKDNPEAIRLEIARDKDTGLPKIDKLFDADGEPILDAKGKQMRGVIFNKEAYQLRDAPGLSKDDVTAIHQGADALVAHTNEAIKDPSIAAGVGWYGRMRSFLQKAFGANIELFGQLLGATSARTPVDTNFKQALEAIRLFSRGHYDELLQRFANHINEVHAKANDGTLLRQWIAKSSKNNEGNFDLQKAVRQEINKFDEVPLREAGAKYNANSQKVLHALYGNWIEQTVGPKTPNFAGNLTGRTLKATIDVWAARNLRRLLYEGKVKRWRILPEQEQAVGSNYNKAGELTGDFPFAQKIYDEAANRLGMNPDDLQALIWFAEKDVWEKNGWTNTVGAEKSSFDKEAGKLNMDRYQGGVTTFQNHDQFDPVVQNQERLRLRVAASQIPGLQASRITHSDGLYGNVVEPTFDAELSVQRNPDGSAPSIAPFTKQIIDIAKQHNQSDAFISKVVDVNHPNARPMVEIGFKAPGLPDEIQKIITAFQSNGIDGFTVSKDSHGRVLGIRSQYIPEISARYDGGHKSQHLDPAHFGNNCDDWIVKTRKALASLTGIDNISYKEESYVSTHVYGKEEYNTAAPTDLARGSAIEELGRRKRILSGKSQ